MPASPWSLLLSSSHLHAPSSARRASFYRMWTVAVMDSERRGPGAIEIIASLEVVILVIWPYLKNGWNPQQETKTFFFFKWKKQKKQSGVCKRPRQRRRQWLGTFWKIQWVESNDSKWIKWIEFLAWQWRCIKWIKCLNRLVNQMNLNQGEKASDPNELCESNEAIGTD